MEYVNLGTTGLKVSRICLGTMTFGSPEWRDWVMGEAESLPFIQRALDLGINFFDTADMYSVGQSEVVLGNTLQKLGVQRDKVVIATKFHNPMGDDPNQRGQSRKHIRHAIDDSLRRLRVDYVDLYQIHRFDPHTPIEESLDALDGLVRAGKVLYLGASSMYAWQFARLLYTADRLGLQRFVTMQNHYNLVYREEEREMNPLCQAEGVGLIPWSPLARGFLTKNRPKDSGGATVRGKSDGFSQSMYKEEADYAVVDQVSAIAAERGVSNAEVALAWLLHQRGVTAPIVGATKLEHIDAAVRAAALRLSPQELEALGRPYVPHPVLGHG
jgi:aryl-alcohol dehydrogenase-like predicted oxidoreductase